MTETPRCPDCGVAGEWHALVVQPRYECPLCGAVVDGETA